MSKTQGDDFSQGRVITLITLLSLPLVFNKTKHLFKNGFTKRIAVKSTNRISYSDESITMSGMILDTLTLVQVTDYLVIFLKDFKNWGSF